MSKILKVVFLGAFSMVSMNAFAAWKQDYVTDVSRTRAVFTNHCSRNQVVRIGAHSVDGDSLVVDLYRNGNSEVFCQAIVPPGTERNAYCNIDASGDFTLKVYAFSRSGTVDGAWVYMGCEG